MNTLTIHQLLEYPIPSFNVLEQGKRKDTLIHCFLLRKELEFSPSNKPSTIKAKNGEVYHIIWDFPLPLAKQKIQTIISFQKHTFGNFAIIRASHSPMEAEEFSFEGN